MSLNRIIFNLLLVVLLWLPASAFAQEIQPDASVTIHVVQRGENLFRIAMRYNVTVDDLTRMNGILNAGSIQVGQRLLVPAHAAPVSSEVLTHIVQPGETLENIAALYNVQAVELAQSNTLADEVAIYIGQVLIIPTSALEPLPAVDEQPSPQASAASIVHIIQRGETLFRIATSYGITVSELSRANGITDPSLIYAGQQLLIPGHESPQLAIELPAPITSIDVLPQTLVEGQAARLRLVTSTPVTISGAFLNRILNVISDENNTHHTILQGIPLFTEAGIYPLDLLLIETNTGQQTNFSLSLQVAGGRYGSESISLIAGRDDLLNPAVEEAELSLLQRVMTIVSEPRQFNGPMGLPAAATIISPFGTRRSYNGSAFDRFHSGTDFAGAPGTPILATAPGRVVLADTLNVRGIATVIDHGWGVFTGYWHQSEQYVRVGDIVTSGQTIGTIGSTGRVTGAHLHWELWVGGVPVDPMQWVRQSFT